MLRQTAYVHCSQAKLVNSQSDKVIHPGLYLHVPFCATTCDFCAFYQEAPRRADLLRYLEGIERELDHWCAEWDAHTAAADFLPALDAQAGLTVFFGGGTPGLLAAPDLARLCQAVRERAPGPIAEWTVEMAPSTVKADKIAAMREAGVNRISMGVQSFDETLLEKLGRRHNPKQVLRAYQELRDGGCDNVNLDLIFAVPGQSLEQWRDDLQRAIDLQPEHISTYCLTFEEDTKLWVKLSKGEFKRDIEQEAELYQFTWEMLAAAGYPQYEVSNFTKPGYACAHNLSTWRMGQWRGVGPSAASQWGPRRWSNPSDLNQWLAGLENYQLGQLADSALDVVPLSTDIVASDALIFGLRLNDGVNLAALRARFPAADWATYNALWAELFAEGVVEQTGDRLRLTDAGRLLADSVGGRVLEASV
ncbi:radical SAM family heme chaperone HemW [Cerasicoccus maritimus]|uniref:radical SAM family heme chaperone HemW n=1 Tax=Cerasicoccus maritimus TaxID=490089 RepID=UPI0028527D4C|nr:radical SAM family heme chaperone HemW [Cerasicoccus maritimus]